jgi:RsiW-degrading membrane proteinase PrsW (M82 family)
VDSELTAAGLATIGLTLLVLAAPVVAVWVALVSLPGVERRARTDAVCGFGCGMIAAGVASLLGRVVYRNIGMADVHWLTVYVPLVEETLKALAIALAIGVLVVARADRLSLRRCAIATVAVGAAFAACENFDHMSVLFIGDAFPGDRAAMMERLQVRALLPPLGHLAETWVVGAAIWLASRCRPGQRLALLLPALATAAAVHALWNASALRWWPNPWPLLAIVAVSIGGAIGFCLVAAKRQRRELVPVTVPAPARPGTPQPVGHR